MFAIGVRIVVMRVTMADGSIASKIDSIGARPFAIAVKIGATAGKTFVTAAKIAAIVATDGKAGLQSKTRPTSVVFV